MPFPPYGVLIGLTSLNRSVRFSIYRNKKGTFIVRRRRSQALTPKSPIVCSQCGKEYVRKKAGRCGACKSTEFIFIRENGKAAYIDFKDRFSREIDTGKA